MKRVDHMFGGLDAPPGSRRELLRVALPLVASSGSLSLMYVIDRVLLTWYSTDALAAALPAGLIHWTLISLLWGTACYVNTFVAQYEGAGRPDRVAAALWQGIFFALAASLAVMAVAPFSRPLFDWLGHDPAIRELEIDYFRILCYGTAPLVLQGTLACFFSGRGKCWVIMWVNLACVVVNLGLDYLLIFGYGPFPAWGIEGAAVATVAANLVAVVLYVAVMYFGADGRRYLLSRCCWDRELMGRLIRFGLPNGFHLFVDIVCYTAFVHLVGIMGKEQLTATNLAFNLNSLAFVPMLGFGTAISTLTGQRIGEGRPELAVRTTWMAFRMTCIYMLVFCGVYLLLPDVILLPYAHGSDPAEFAVLRQNVIVLLRFVAIYSLFDAMAIVFSAAVRGAGDTRFAMWFTAISGWLLLVLPTYAAYHYASDPLIAAWAACTLFIVVLGIGFMVRFQGGRWKRMRVIEPMPIDVLVAEHAGALALEPQATSYGASS